MCIYYVKSLERCKKTIPALIPWREIKTPGFPWNTFPYCILLTSGTAGPLGFSIHPLGYPGAYLKIQQTIDKARRLALCPSGGGRGTQGEPPWIQQASQSQGFFFFFKHLFHFSFPCPLGSGSSGYSVGIGSGILMVQLKSHIGLFLLYVPLPIRK